MAEITREKLEEKIAAMTEAGIDASDEIAELEAMGEVVAPPKRGAKVPVKAPAKVPAKKVEEEDDLFIPLNLESFRRGGGGAITPETTGWKDAICTGLMRPAFAPDQAWFWFENVEGADEKFRGALVTGSLDKSPDEGSGAWKVKEVLDAMEIEYEEDEEQGGIHMSRSPKGVECQVEWDDIWNKRSQKTERRIQDVQSGVEAAI